MIKKLVQTLSKVPGLGALRRFLREDDPARPNDPSASVTAETGDGAARPAQRSGAPAASGTRSDVPRASVPRRLGIAEKVGSPNGKTAAVASPELAVGTAPGESAGSGPGGQPSAEFRQDPVRQGPRIDVPAPAAVGGQRLGLAAVGPARAFAFWEISAQAVRRARTHLEERGGSSRASDVILRVHDISRIEFDGTNARRTSDVTVGDTTRPEAGLIRGRRHLDLWADDLDAPSPSRIFCELGVRNDSGEFVALAGSPILDLPLLEVAPARAPLVRAPVNAAAPTDSWRPRLEPRPAPSSSETYGQDADAESFVDAQRFAAASVAAEGEPTSAALHSDREATGTTGRRAGEHLAMPEVGTFSSPSSADLARWRRRRETVEQERLRPPLGGVSSGLFGRRKADRPGGLSSGLLGGQTRV